ncbi:DUF2974 domain-containing protein [Bacillus sp. B-jedd]|uniref:DUF2974 domain-containing protein n=1 Tax=Bacillus sp. B-jedd TaxID=1476857 RepID=UPI0005155509|nr:DUF2974 domain-containing protein [Bacillus sp. B-jedd]CEG28525.1 hypothetical protein BN1002_03446 [Bacillus sp. B-jedd]
MPYNIQTKERISLDQLNDEQKALLNKVAYFDLLSGWDGESDGKPQKLYNIVKETDQFFAEKLKYAGLGDLVIKDYINKNEKGMGFCAIAFEDPYTGDVGMSFRGTEGLDGKRGVMTPLKDMLDNIHTMSYGSSVQALEANAFYQKNKHPDGQNFLYGHSKGGELGSEVFVLNHEDIRGITIINAQPINPFKLNLNQWKAIRSEKFDAIVVKGDIVSYLGMNIYPIRIVKDNGSQDGTFGPHSIESIEFVDGKAVPDHNPSSGNFGQLGLKAIASRITTGIQMHTIPVSYFVGVIVRTGDLLINDLPEMVVEMAQYLNYQIEAIGKLKRETKDFLIEFTATLINTVTFVFKVSTNPGFNYAVRHPRIKVDTYKLRHYGQRLKNINKQLANLDQRLDSLYTKGGLLDLLTIMSADLMTGESWKLKWVVSYLEETADNFEAAESKLLCGYKG